MITSVNAELPSTWRTGKSGGKKKKDKMRVEMKDLQFTLMIVLILSLKSFVPVAEICGFRPKQLLFLSITSTS